MHVAWGKRAPVPSWACHGRQRRQHTHTGDSGAKTPSEPHAWGWWGLEEAEGACIERGGWAGFLAHESPPPPSVCVHFPLSYLPLSHPLSVILFTSVCCGPAPTHTWLVVPPHLVKADNHIIDCFRSIQRRLSCQSVFL